MRTTIVKIRLTKDEHRRLKTLAGKRGISRLLRTLALGPDRREQQEGRLQLVAELARIRNLLLQIALNSSAGRPLEQVRIIFQLVHLERALSRIPIS